ncbi:MAG: phosphotransferase family protein [Myxococcaceae bacterium]
METGSEVRRGLEELLRKLYPGCELRQVEPLGPDTGSGATGKAEGYGRPLRLVVGLPGEGERTLVFHTATSNEFGHDRRADRAAELLLAYDTFNTLPGHVRATDVGAIAPEGELRSLGGTGKFYLLTSWAKGRPYAEDLRRIARGGLGPLDLPRGDALCDYLVRLHTPSQAGAAKYRRSVRDLVGHGEGVFGMIDAYPEDTPGAPARRLELIEGALHSWRWRLRGFEGRLARIHGDFHPFNLVFEEGTAAFTALDAARGCLGDPADDLTALSVNYLFFALERPASWRAALGVLWRRLWDRYLERSGDREVLEVAAPYFAWRALVVCSPVFYPSFPAGAREALLGLVERALAARAFDPAWADELFP